MEAAFYSCFGFRLRSDLPLPELVVALDAADQRPVVDVRVKALSAWPAESGELVHGVQTLGDACRFTIAGVATYLMRGGREILVDPAPGATARTVRLFLLGSALGLLIHQRGLLPLHANTIVMDGRAHAFAGPSGAGKSTLAAWFAQAGHRVLGDDLCVVGFDQRGAPQTWPGLPRLKLWAEAAAAFRHDVAALDRAMEEGDKFHLPLPDDGDAAPVPFRRLYLLERGEAGAETRIDRLRGRAAMAAIMAHTYRGTYLPLMQLSARHFAQAAALTERIPVFSVRRAWGYERFDREAERLARHLGETV